MAFCTLLEWDGEFDLGRYKALNERAGAHDRLPNGCLSRIVGRVDDGGARIIEVWRSSDDAQRFSEENGPLIVEFKIPPPSRVAAFETTVFQLREDAG